MDLLLAVLTGCIISFILFFEGEMANYIGPILAVIFVQAIGFTVSTPMVLPKTKRKSMKGIPWFSYLAGSVGAIGIILNILAYQKIGIASATAFSFFGQTISAVLIDAMGLFGVKKIKITYQHAIAFAIILVGLGFMIDTENLLACILAVGAGLCIVFKRLLNAKLAANTTREQSLWFYFGIGTLSMILIYALVGFPKLDALAKGFPYFFLIAGLLSYSTNYLQNILSLRNSVFLMTMIMFSSMLLSGYVLDGIFLHLFSYFHLFGGLLVILGGVVKQRADQKVERKDHGVL